MLVFLTEQRRLQGGWLLRKAYNMYEKLFKEVKKVHDKVHKQHEEAGSSAKQQKQLSKVQRQALMAMAPALPHTPTASLERIHNIKPIDLTLMKLCTFGALRVESQQVQMSIIIVFEVKYT